MSTATPPLAVACSADRRFIADCAVMLRSLLLAGEAAGVRVFFLYDGELPAEDREALGRMVQELGALWRPVEVPQRYRSRFPLTERFGLNAWYRTLLPELLSEEARVLYLDSDLLILEGLQELWERDLGANLLAAVTQPTEDRVLGRLRDTLGLPDAQAYFNSGVMLLDLEGLRQEQLSRQILDFLDESRAPTPWADQDPLNAVLHQRRLHLAPRWNAMSPFFLARRPSALFTPAEREEAVRHPAIVHFIGPYKPWHFRCRHPYRAAYFAHLRHTPWCGKPVVGRSLRHALLRFLPWEWQFKLDALIDRAAARVAGRRSEPVKAA